MKLYNSRLRMCRAVNRFQECKRWAQGQICKGVSQQQPFQRGK